jgi:hypothetical protein
MTQQEIKGLVSEMYNLNYADLTIQPVVIELDLNTTNNWAPTGSEILFVQSVLLAWNDATNFVDADKPYLRLTNSLFNVRRVNFNLGGPTGHHALNPLELNFVIDTDIQLNVGSLPIPYPDVSVFINGYILDLVP